MSNLSFYKPNELIAVIDQIQVNRLAKHLCNYFLRHAQEQIKFHAHSSSWFELNIHETNTLAEIRHKDMSDIEKSLDALMSPVTLRDSDDPKKFIKIVLISTMAVDPSNGIYRFELSNTMLDLLKSTDYFTKLQLNEFNDFESKHSFVIYEWLKRYENAHNIPIMPIETLRAITHTSDKKTYDNFSHIQMRILNVATEEINKKTPYSVTYEAIKKRAKTRNKVTELRWTFKRKEDQSNVSNTSQNQNPITQELERVKKDYSDLAKLYVENDYCENEAQFYEATYKVDYTCLYWFYKDRLNYKSDKKKLNKLNWLLDDWKNGRLKKGYRDKEQLDKYYELLDKLPEAMKKQSITYQSRHGFYEHILLIKRYLNDTTRPKDPEKWL